MPKTYYLDLIRELTRLNRVDDRTSQERAVLAQLAAKEITVGEAVQMLFPHIGLKSQALLAIIHLANLSDTRFTFEDSVNAMQDLAIAQHKASHIPDNAAFTTDLSPHVPEVHIHEVTRYFEELRSGQHARKKSNFLVSCHL